MSDKDAETSADGSKPTSVRHQFRSIEPILAVEDIVLTVNYWQEVLGFPRRWMWGDPPVHAGVNQGDVQIQFSLQPELARSSRGNSIAIYLKEVEKSYQLHIANGAEITSPLESKPWGIAEYSVREINGYILRIGAQHSYRNLSEELPNTVQFVSRTPSIEEYRSLVASVGWEGTPDDARLKAILEAPLHSEVAIDLDTGKIIGCALLLGDGASFYYVKDVMVRPEWQSKRVGTAIMQRLTDWAERNAPPNAMMALYTGEGLAPFYRQFGFSPGFGMIRMLGNSNSK